MQERPRELDYRWTLLMAAVCLLEARSSPASDGWQIEKRVGDFVYHADFELDAYQPLLEEIVQLKRDIETTVGFPERRQVLDIYLFGKQKDYQNYVKHYFPTAPNRRAMFIKSRYPGNVFAYDHPELAVDLRHECTHAVLHSHLPHVPLWLDEGLAEYFEVDSEKRASKNTHLTSIRRAVIWRRAPSLERLEPLESLSEMSQREYRDAWAWVHFMIHGPKPVRFQMVNYIRDIQRETTPEPLSRRIARLTTNTDEQFVEHFKQWK